MVWIGLGMDRSDPHTVLIVDDDLIDRKMMTRAFNEANIQSKLTILDGGKKAIEYVSKSVSSSPDGDLGEYNVPSIIFLDLNMPEINGLEVLESIKKIKESAHIPVILFTSSADENDIRKTYDLGACSFVVKPLEYSSLVSQMKKICDYWFYTAKLPTIKV